MPSNWKICFIFLLFFIAEAAVAQDSNRLQKAFAFSKNGRYEQAAVEFTSILRKDSTNAEALEGRALNALRSKHFAQAEFDFLKLLRLQPNNLSAENGLAQALAGQQRYADAIDIFDEVIIKTRKTTDTLNNIEALRGKGYANFNRQHYYDALKVFLLLSQEFGDKQEYLTYIAKIYTALQHQYDARRAIKQLRKINSDSGFDDLEYAVQSSPALVEVSLLGGYSQVGGANKLGANGVEAVIRPAHNLEFYEEYDNWLGRDILSMIKNNIPQFSLYSGGSYSIGKKNNFLTTLEFGHRHYSNHSFQRSLKVEEVISLASISLKGGYIYAPKSDHIPDWHPTKEYLYYGGMGINKKNWNAEATYYYSTDDISNNIYRRLMALANYQWYRGTKLTIGGFAGRDQINLSSHYSVMKDAYGVFIYPEIPVGKVNWLVPQLRYTEVNEKQVVEAVIGFKFRFED